MVQNDCKVIIRRSFMSQTYPTGYYVISASQDKKNKPKKNQAQNHKQLKPLWLKQSYWKDKCAKENSKNKTK